MLSKLKIRLIYQSKIYYKYSNINLTNESVERFANYYDISKLENEIDIKNFITETKIPNLSFLIDMVFNSFNLFEYLLSIFYIFKIE